MSDDENEQDINNLNASDLDSLLSDDDVNLFLLYIFGKEGKKLAIKPKSSET